MQGESPLRGMFSQPAPSAPLGYPQTGAAPLGVAGQPAPIGGAGFNPYAAGAKVYGQGQTVPNIGPTSPQGQMGYNQRDQMNAVRRDALINRATNGPF